MWFISTFNIHLIRHPKIY